MRKAQITMDFIIIAVFVLIIFVVFFGLYFEKIKGLWIVEGKLSAKRTADGLARAVNAVLASTNSTQASVRLNPVLENGDRYNVSISGGGRRVEIFWWTGTAKNASKNYAAPIMTSNVTDAEISPPANVVITNVDGYVRVEWYGA